MLEERKKSLAKQALEAQGYSYSPYSNFQVGAALLGKNNLVYTGCNIENKAFSPTNCAERTAFFKAISQGVTEFQAIAIVGNPKGVSPEDHGFCTPCGVCLQVMAEFCDPEEFEVIFVQSPEKTETHLLKELLPFAFQK